VVADLIQLRAEQLGHAVDVASLGLGFGVAGEQHPRVAVLDTESEHRVVRVVEIGELAGADDVDSEVTDGVGLALTGLADGGVARLDGGDRVVVGRRVVLAGLVPDLVDVDGIQHLGHLPDVIGVPVRQRQHIHLVGDAGVGETGGDVAAAADLAGVHQDLRIAGADQRRVGLADVEELHNDLAGRAGIEA